MVGLALVTVVATLGAGLRESDRKTLEDTVHADYVVTSKNGFDPFPQAAGDALAKVPGVTGSASMRQDRAKIFGEDRSVSGIPPGFTQFFDLYLGGDAAGTVAGLGRARRDHRRQLRGRRQPARRQPFPDPDAVGQHLALQVEGITSPPTVQKIDPLIGKVVISQSAFDGSFPRAAEPVQLRRHERGRDRREHRGAEGARRRTSPTRRSRPRRAGSTRAQAASTSSSTCSTSCWRCR